MKVGSVVILETSLRDYDRRKLIGIVESIFGEYAVCRYCYSDLASLHNDNSEQHRRFYFKELTVIKE